MKTTHDQGFSLLELFMAMTILAIGLLGVAATFLSTSLLTAETRRTDVLKSGLTNVVESLRNTPLEHVFSEYGSESSRAEIFCTTDGMLVFTDPGNAIARGTVSLYDTGDSLPSEFSSVEPSGSTQILSPNNNTLPALITLTSQMYLGDRELVLPVILRRKATE